jgi:tRNA-dihydrouridine synthase
MVEQGGVSRGNAFRLLLNSLLLCNTLQLRIFRRRCGPADLAAVNEIAEYIHTTFPKSDIRILSNGNIYDTLDAKDCLNLGRQHCYGVMSAEGALRNPALFRRLRIISHEEKQGNIKMNPIDSSALEDEIASASSIFRADDNFSAVMRGHGAVVEAQSGENDPNLLSLFTEYCELSEKYELAGGWAVLGKIRKLLCVQFISVVRQFNEFYVFILIWADAYDAAQRGEFKSKADARQVSTARQHLTWMLGKSGHGRLVRFKYGLLDGGASCSVGTGGGTCYYRKNVHIMKDLNEATSLVELLEIAKRCLGSHTPGLRESDHPTACTNSTQVTDNK